MDIEDVVVKSLRANGITAGTRLPEQDVLDEIDCLVTDFMKHGIIADRYHNGVPICPVCGTEWHGLRGDGVIGVRGCPGEYGTPAEKRRWKRDYKSRVAVAKKDWK